MAARRAVTYISGRLKELPAGDTLSDGNKLIDVFRPRDLYPDATSFMSLDSRNSIAVLDADGGSINEIVRGIVYLPLGLDYSAGIKARGWVTATSATSGNARYGFRMMRFNTSIDTDSFSTAVEAHAAVSATLGVPTVIEVSNTNLDGAVAGEAMIFEWYRDASDTTNDTASGDTETALLVLETAA
ncbi:MAG: hypothetical protein ACT4QA_18340 [Panacagrimonas sp.]